MTDNPIDGFTVSKEDFKFIGEGLQRPECILAEKNGDLWAADARGGVVRLRPDGSQEIITQSHDADAFESSSDDANKFVEGTLPNGLAFADNGDILISNFGTDCLERMTRTGETTVMFDTVNGEPIGKVNFVCRDSKNRVWITVSTMVHDWPTAIRKDLIDGRVLLYEEGSASSTLTRNISTWCRPAAATSRATRSPPTAASVPRRSMAPATRAVSSTAAPSTPTAICGAPM
jgi:sugar lactone lactonase YvrE